MKYVDSITKIKDKKIPETAKTQEAVSFVKSSLVKKHSFYFFEKNKRFGLVSIIIIISLIVGFFIIKKNHSVIEVKKQIIKQKKTADFLKNDKVVDKEFEVFHIKIDTEGFHVDSDIIEGDKDSDLHKGIVHQKGSAFPSQYSGNVIITGHRWYPGDGKFSKIFQDIDKLKQGDKIVIDYKNKKYIYIVDKKVVVDKNNTKFLEHTIKPQLTIYTCHPKFTSKQRLVYVAGLKSIRSIKDLK